ncbi:MAG: L,D-transpeptidase [Chloroflexi bacterium]|nr:L,D-transpeptidase [Chloroflexota bacterium]
MRPVLFAVLVSLFFAIVPAAAAAPLAENPPDWAVGNGHFYTQTSGGRADAGFAVVDWGDDQLFTEFSRLGATTTLGYPISRRFSLDGRVTQAFQYGALQWNPQTRQADVLATLDYLSAKGKDEWLRAEAGVPAPLPASFDAGKSSEQIASARLALLEAEPALKNRYFFLARPELIYGLPASPVADNGSHTIIRLQRSVMQHWRVDSVEARAGEVTLVPVGYLLKNSGVAGAPEVYEPEAAPPVTNHSGPTPGNPPAAPAPAPGTPPPASAIPVGERWIDVNIANQTTSAMVGDQVVYTALVTTGRPGNDTPTGTFRIFSRVFNETMDSSTLGIPVNAPGGYYLRNVYFTQYFASGGYALHSNYWAPRDVFGNRPTSAGCVGMVYDDAEFFWNFASIGTRVVVHR